MLVCVSCCFTAERGAKGQRGAGGQSRLGELVDCQALTAIVVQDRNIPLGALKLQGLVAAVINHLSKQGCKESVRPTAVCRCLQHCITLTQQGNNRYAKREKRIWRH